MIVSADGANAGIVRYLIPCRASKLPRGFAANSVAHRQIAVAGGSGAEQSLNGRDLRQYSSPIGGPSGTLGVPFLHSHISSIVAGARSSRSLSLCSRK